MDGTLYTFHKSIETKHSYSYGNINQENLEVLYYANISNTKPKISEYIFQELSPLPRAVPRTLKKRLGKPR